MITVQADHIVHRRPGLADDGFECGEHVLRLPAEIGRESSLGVDPNDAGYEDMTADSNGGGKIGVVGKRLPRGGDDRSGTPLHGFSLCEPATPFRWGDTGPLPPSAPPVVNP